ncbi:MAG TPA: sterol desaturase family protein [Crenotrichaceae bacterium]|nr:sterol desaturase family protein [Crenotrichaceae bacterium]
MIENHLTLLRLSIFILILCTLLLAEWKWGFRRYLTSKFERLIDNLGLMIVSSVLQRLLSAGGAVAVALWAMQNNYGLLHHIALPQWLVITLSVLALDFAIYLQHLVFHRINLLWRIHQVHHSDIGFDCTTAVRFHFIEILLSTLYKMLLVVLIGAPAFAVVLFEILLNGFALFNHSNLHFPPALDKWLRNFVITPDMHRIHHSAKWSETNSNYGFSVPFWDKLCGTYVSDPELGQEKMKIGLPDEDNSEPVHFVDLLLMPFQAQK